MSEESKLERLKLKIKSLLEKNVSRGATEAEAESAMRAAAKLMEEYDLTEAEIHGAQRADKKLCVTGIFKLQTKHHPWSTHAAYGICEFLDTKWWNSWWYRDGEPYAAVAFFGPPNDVEIANYLMAVCHNGIEIAWRGVSRIHGGSKTARQSFYQAAAYRLNERFRQMKAELRPTGTALVVLKGQLVTKEYNEGPGLNMKYKSKSVQGGYDISAAIGGKQAADRINLTTGLQNAQNKMVK